MLKDECSDETDGNIKSDISITSAKEEIKHEKVVFKRLSKIRKSTRNPFKRSTVLTSNSENQVETSTTDVLKQSFKKICPLCKKNIDNLPIERLCVCQQLLSIRSSFKKKGTVLKTDSIDLTNYVESPQKGSERNNVAVRDHINHFPKQVRFNGIDSMENSCIGPIKGILKGFPSRYDSSDSDEEIAKEESIVHNDSLHDFLLDEHGVLVQDVDSSHDSDDDIHDNNQEQNDDNESLHDFVSDEYGVLVGDIYSSHDSEDDLQENNQEQNDDNESLHDFVPDEHGVLVEDIDSSCDSEDDIQENNQVQDDFNETLHDFDPVNFEVSDNDNDSDQVEDDLYDYNDEQNDSDHGEDESSDEQHEQNDSEHIEDESSGESDHAGDLDEHNDEENDSDHMEDENNDEQNDDTDYAQDSDDSLGYSDDCCNDSYSSCGYDSD